MTAGVTIPVGKKSKFNNYCEEVQDRVRGVITGIAAGDRIGGPIRMAVRLAESLVIQNRFDINHIRDCYFKWWAQGGFDTGLVTEKVFELAATGVPFSESVEQVDRELGEYTAGCNPVHRNMPIAMATFISDKELSSAAVQEACLTHKHIYAGDVAAATLILCRNLIRGVEWTTALQKASEGRTLQTCQALRIGSTRLSLDVSAGNKGAHKLYEHRGMIIESQWPKRLTIPGLRFFRMVKAL